MHTPNSFEGVLLVAGLGLVAIVWLFTTGWGPLLLGVAIIALVLYAVYLAAMKVHRRLMYGRLWPRLSRGGGDE